MQCDKYLVHDRGVAAELWGNQLMGTAMATGVSYDNVEGN